MNDTMNQEKNILEYKMQKMKDQLEGDITRAKRQYDDLLASKAQMDADYKTAFVVMDEKHLKGVEELESLYERKLAYENEKYIQQEQELREERIKFERKI